VGILLNGHVVLPFIDIRMLCASHDVLWLFKSVEISISTARNINIELFSGYGTKQKLLSIKLIGIYSNLSTTWTEAEGTTFHIWPSVKMPTPARSYEKTSCSNDQEKNQPVPHAKHIVICYRLNRSLRKHWRTGRNWFSIMAWCQWISQHTAFGTMTRR
jgi:hypothetical protein